MNERSVNTLSKTESRPGETAGRSANAVQPARPSHDWIVGLHSTIGNQAVQRLFQSYVLQPKLAIGKSGDENEREADRAADQVIRMPEPAIQGKPG